MKNAQLLSVLCLTTLMTASLLCSQDEQATTVNEIFPSTAVTQSHSDVVISENNATTLTDTTSLEQVSVTQAAIQAPSVVSQTATSVQEEVTKAGCFATAVVSLKEQGNKLATYVGASRIAQFVQTYPKISSAIVTTVVVAGIAWYYKDAIKNWVNKKQASRA